MGRSPGLVAATQLSSDALPFERTCRTQIPLAPGFIAPCLPIAAERCKNGPAWVHEIKYDGYRMIARRNGDPRAALHSPRVQLGGPHSLRRRVFAAGLPGVDAFRSALLVLQASDARPGALEIVAHSDVQRATALAG